jgi:hypothetical protein
MTYNYIFDNFIENPIPGNSKIRILNKNGVFKYDINANVSYFYTKNNFVVIKVEDEKEIALDFENSNEATRALTKLNSIKITLSKKPSSSDVYTKEDLDDGALDFRYYTHSQVVNISTLVNYYEKSEVLTTTQTFNTFIPLSGSSNISGNLNPIITNNYNLGNLNYRWNYLYSKNINLPSDGNIYFNNSILSLHPSNSGILLFNGNGISLTNQLYLNQLNDVSIISPTDLQILQYSAGTWKNKPFDLSNYYTTGETYSKIELQNSGQSSIHWNNITNNPFSVIELFDIAGSSNIILDSIHSGLTNNVVWKYVAKCKTSNAPGVKIGHLMVCWDQDLNIDGSDPNAQGIGYSEIQSEFVGDYPLKIVTSTDINFSVIMGDSNYGIPNHITLIWNKNNDASFLGPNYVWDVRIIRELI